VQAGRWILHKAVTGRAEERAAGRWILHGSAECGATTLLLALTLSLSGSPCPGITLSIDSFCLSFFSPLLCY
jgi:hypothetical protein